MFNEIIVNRFANLKYLSPLKKSNVSIMSKNNQFGDIVKFFAQVNSDNIIQKITFKATGCSTFLVLCDYFCELVEGKSIDNALEITDKDLSSFATIDKSKEHVYPIILDTFKLLIKKYKKGVEKNNIVPIPIENDKSSESVDKLTESKSDSITIEEKKTSHLMALRQKINHKENNEKAHNHASSLNSMLRLMNKNKDSVKNQETQDTIIIEEPKEGKKKSIFNWFKKK